jgi:hypothetical protein
MFCGHLPRGERRGLRGGREEVMLPVCCALCVPVRLADSGNLIVGVLHSTRDYGAERPEASRSLRRTRLRGRVTPAQVAPENTSQRCSSVASPTRTTVRVSRSSARSVATRITLITTPSPEIGDFWLPVRLPSGDREKHWLAVSSSQPNWGRRRRTLGRALEQRDAERER